MKPADETLKGLRLRSRSMATGGRIPVWLGQQLNLLGDVIL